MESDYKEQLISFHERHKRMPTYSEMATLFGFKSKNAVARVVTKLIAAGIVTKDKLGKLLPTDMFSGISVLGSVKAGFPSLAEQQKLSTINLDDFLIQKKSSTYLLEVDGKSMIDAHIDDGDMVLVERTEQAKDGDIVIAQVDGEFTMKYLRNKGGKLWLEPANKSFKPIYPEYELSIVAVVKAVIRKY